MLARNLVRGVDEAIGNEFVNLSMGLDEHILILTVKRRRSREDQGLQREHRTNSEVWWQHVVAREQECRAHCISLKCHFRYESLLA